MILISPLLAQTKENPAHLSEALTSADLSVLFRESGFTFGRKGAVQGAGVEANEFSFFQDELPDFALIRIGFVSARATLPQDLATWGDFIHQEGRPKGGGM